jgi:Bacterial toxin 50
MPEPPEGEFAKTADIDKVESNFSTSPVGSPAHDCSVGQPGFWESLIPIWGSGRAAIDDFQNGRWGWGLFNSALAVTDIFLVKSLATAGAKLGGKLLAKVAGKEAAELAAKEAAELATKEAAERAAKEAAELEAKQAVEDAEKPIIHEGKQGKHVPGHNNFQPGKSELTHPDPQALLDKGAGTGVKHGNKEVVDFGENIGDHVAKDGTRSPTTRGTIHYDKSGGAHIVPSKPN